MSVVQELYDDARDRLNLLEDQASWEQLTALLWTQFDGLDAQALSSVRGLRPYEFLSPPDVREMLLSRGLVKEATLRGFARTSRRCFRQC